VRGALAALSALAAVAAVVLGARHTWPDLSHGVFHDTAAEAEQAPARHEQLPLGLFERWKAELKPGQTWWLAVPSGAKEGLTTRGGVYRTFALYWFLPNLPARSGADADVVFRVDNGG
jgi:hypothetical protein